MKDLKQAPVISKPGDRDEDGLNLVALIADNVLVGNDVARKAILKKNRRFDPEKSFLQQNVGSKLL